MNRKKERSLLKRNQTKIIVKGDVSDQMLDEHDYEFKKKHAEKFLKKDGAKLKAFVF